MMQQKPKGVGVMIAFGKPKEGPPPLRRMDQEDEPPARPRETPRETPVDASQEQGESAMDFGAMGEKFGLDAESAKAFAYDVLEACMKMTGGGRHEEAEPQPEEYNESETENYSA